MYQSAHSLEKVTTNGGVETKEKYNFDERATYIKTHVEAAKPGYAQKMRGELVGISADLLRDLPEMMQRVEQMRVGDDRRAAADISLGQYAKIRYGIETDEAGSMDNLLHLLGIRKNEVTLDMLAGKTQMNFTATPDLNSNFRWLLGETVTEALRSGMMQRGYFRRLVSKMETVPFDSIKVPVIKNPSGQFKELREGETFKTETIEFDEIAMETKDVGTSFNFTDRMLRNVRINILQNTLAAKNGFQLDVQLTNEAVSRLINGNTAASNDAAPIVGVTAPGSFDYDNDWLEIVIGMAQLGYLPSTVVGSRGMIKEAMSLPEFKGFDGNIVKANTQVSVPLPSDYQFIPTGAMPAKGPSGGQLLFVDSRYAMAHYQTKPLTLENERIYNKLSERFYVSLTSCFVKEQDASMILDSTVNITVNPFPAEYDMEVYERAAGGF